MNLKLITALSITLAAGSAYAAGWAFIKLAKADVDLKELQHKHKWLDHHYKHAVIQWSFQHTIANGLYEKLAALGHDIPEHLDPLVRDQQLRNEEKEEARALAAEQNTR